MMLADWVERFAWMMFGFLLGMVILFATVRCQAAEATTEPENWISGLIGYGPDGMDAAWTTHGIRLTPAYQPLVGIQYARKGVIWDEMMLSCQLMTGTSVQTRTVIGAIGVGYGW